LPSLALCLQVRFLILPSEQVIVVADSTVFLLLQCNSTGLWTQFCAAFGAGFFMACTVSPFDMVRTRLMNQPPNARIYNNFIDCFVKVGYLSLPQHGRGPAFSTVLVSVQYLCEWYGYDSKCLFSHAKSCEYLLA
jgi:hypothetical protein